MQESAAEDGEAAAAAEAVDGDVLPSITRSPSLIRNPENCATLAPDFVRIWPLPANDEDSPMPSKVALTCNCLILFHSSFADSNI